jgi:DNA-binding NtrC family response regulator
MASILLVEDDEQFRSMFAESLSLAGYDVQAAGDGLQGIKSYRDRPADLIITDLIMPEKEGLEMIQYLRQNHPEAKIIAMSGGGRYANYDVLKIAKAFGALGVLEKPFARDEMLELVRQVLGA